MKILLSFLIIFFFLACGGNSKHTYTYTPVTQADEEKCIPQLVGGDNNSSTKNDDSGNNGATSDPAMPDNGRNNDDSDDQAVNGAPLAYTEYGKVNITVGCFIYPFVTAVPAKRSKDIVPPTTTLMRMLTPRMPSPYIGQYKIEIGAYSIREERIYLHEGTFVFAFIMPDNEVSGRYKLISPPNKSGVVEVTFVEDRTLELKMEGKIVNAEIYTNEDKNETYTLSLDFSTRLIDKRFTQ